MKGQVAFIVIIAVLVIVGVVGTILIFRPPTVQPPPQVTGAQGFSIERCAERSFEESIALVGLYGGWIEPHPDHITRGDTFSMGGRDFALWARPEQIPTREQLSDAIAQDLSRRLDTCTADLEGPRSVSIDIQLGSSMSRAAIEIDGWIVLDGAEQRVHPFVVESRLPILRARDTAEAFTLELWDEEVLTDLNFDLIALNPEVPLEGVEFTCTPKRWSVSEVADAFFSTVEDSVTYVSFDGTPKTSDARLRERFTFDLNLPADVDLTAYYYTDFGGDLSVDRSSGDVMSSYVIHSPDGVLCQNTYQFWYSMTYPIVFTLTVPSTSDDYLFRFAVPVSVQRNQESEIRSSGDSLFCADVTPRVFSLNVRDAKSGATLDDVRATYVCDTQRCPLASVPGGIEDHLPSRCLSATILLDKEGYAQTRVDYRYDLPLSGTIVELDPLIEVSVSLSCASEPCSYPGVMVARIGTISYPLRVGSSFLPKVPDSIFVLEQTPGSLIHKYTLIPIAGDEIAITVDTDKYASPGGYAITQIFPSGISGGTS